MPRACFGEPVIVGAVFGPGARIRPAWFVRGGRKVRLADIHHVWTEKRGTARIIHFSAGDGTDLFHLALDGETLTWRLLEVETLP